jgi:hypothetical protein
MIDAFKVVRFGLRDYWDEFVLLALFNVLWAVAVILPFIPLLVIGRGSVALALVVSGVLAIPLPIVSGGLAFVTNQIGRGKAVGWGVFATGMRRYWAKSLLVAAINIVVLILLVTNLQFYGLVLQGIWTDFALSIWLIVGIYWLLTQMFWFPMILELQSEKVFVALRHALAMVIITPAFSLTLGIAMAILAVLCIVLSVPAVLVMGSLLLLIANHATRSRLAFVRKEPYQPGIDPGEQKRAR